MPTIGILLNQFLLTPGAYEYKPILLIAPLPLTDSLFRLATACNEFSCLTLSTWFYDYDFVISLAFLFFDALAYFLAALYLEQVFPKPWGVRKSPFFCISCLWKNSKCCGKKGSFEKIGEEEEETDPELRPLEDEDEDVTKAREDVRSWSDPGEMGIIIQGLVKQFGRGKGRNVAVKGVNFGVNHGECFGLLGPNGAGKTTLVRMLSGLFAPSQGTAYVGGHSIKEMDRVRQSLGLCPQFSVVWTDLTPSEHLLFYIRLKGFSLTHERSHAIDILKKVGLDPSAGLPPQEPNCFVDLWRWFFPKERKAAQLSGGMKRRLAIAISLAGDPSVLLLDEPTTGLDPDVRREIWDVVLQEKQSRSVILTTHSMEEADALSDRIGIMSHGRLVCLGSSLHLKGKFGNGYTLSLKFREKHEELLVEFLRRSLTPFASVTLLKRFGNRATYEVRPRPGQQQNENTRFRVSRIFELLESNKKKVGILDFELNQTTLEDVFLNVISKEEETTVVSLRREGSTSLKIDDDDDPIHQQQLFDPFSKTVFVEEVEDLQTIDNGEEQADVFVASTDEEEEEIGVIVEEDEMEMVHPITEETAILAPQPWPSSDHVKPQSTVERILSSWTDNASQIWFLLLKECILSIRAWKTSLCLLLSPFFVVLALVILSLIYTANKPSSVFHPAMSEVPKLLPKCQAWAGGKCYQLMYTLNDAQDPFAADVMDSIVDDFGWVENVDYLSFEWERDMLDYVYLHPNETAVALSVSNQTTYLMSMVNQTIYTIYYNATNDLKSQVVPLKTLLDSRFYYFLDKALGGNATKDDTFSIQTQVFPTPPNRSARNGQEFLFSNSGPLFFCLAAMMLFLVCLHNIVKEKEQGLRAGLEMIGMRQCAYFGSWFLQFVFFAFLMTLVTLAAGYAMVVDVFWYCDPLIMFFVVFSFIVSMVFFAFALSPLLSKAKTALIIGFVVLAVSFILNLFVANVILTTLLYNLEEGWVVVPYLLSILYPPFNFAKAFGDIVRKTVKTYNARLNVWEDPAGYGWSDFTDKFSAPLFGVDFNLPATYESILYLLLNCLLYFLAFIILDLLLWGRGPRQLPRWVKSPPAISNDLAPKILYGNEDEDEVKEYYSVRDPQEKTALRLANVKKTFQTCGGVVGKSVDALNGVCVQARRGQCTSFLGHNGAGKTTLIRCIAGLETATSGEVVVLDALNVRSDLMSIRRHLGVCLQHNLLWPDLTAREHLWLFSKIKGLRTCDLAEEASRRLQDVSLSHVARDRSKTFSGGMKRRLNVAMSFVARPDIVLADEPTTGLDPFSKREVWELIKEKKKESSVLLTTHSMEEADSLSDKIVILHRGRLEAVGDALHLKSKFGAGYVLKFVCDSAQEEAFVQLIAKLFPNAVLIAANAGNYIYSIHPQFISELVEGMKAVEDLLFQGDSMIRDYGLSHDSLETIYMKVTERGERRLVGQRRD